MVEPSAEETLPGYCERCHATLYFGLARCRSCGALRPEFEPHLSVVAEKIGACSLSGATSDVCLPNGEYLWAPYFLDMVAKGWLDEDYALTAKCPWSFATRN